MKAILFDFDGVLVKSMEHHYEGWRRALLKYDIDMIPEELYMLEGQGVTAVASQLTRKYNLPLDETPLIIEKKQEYYDQIKKIIFYPNLLNVLNWAKKKGLKMAIVTGGLRKWVINALESYGLLQFFEVIITSEDVKETKPSPEPYLTAAARLGFEAEDCVVIENSPLGIRSGKLAGMQVIALTTTLNSYFLRQADVVVGDMIELHQVLKRLY
jgi:beta-phosphoglucomutase